MTVNLVKCTFKGVPASWTFKAPSNITISDNFLVGSISFICFKNWLQMNVPFLLFPSAKWPWQPTIYKTATGMFPPEAIIFNNGYIEIVAPSLKNNNPNISASLLIIENYIFMFCSWITSRSSLDIIFMLWVI